MIGSVCSLKEILANKERRAHEQKKLLAHSPSCFLISLSVNIPSAIKLSHESLVIHDIAHHGILDLLKENGFLLYASYTHHAITGVETLFTCKGDAYAFKALTCRFENRHPLGRLMDIDVFDEKGALLSRSMFDLPKRKCLLCEKEAFICARGQTHSYEALNLHIKMLVKKYAFVHLVALLCERAMLKEVELTPKPGLVDRVNSGAHKDMDIQTFYASIEAIKPYIKEFLQVEPLSFDTLRTIGLTCEKAMFEATKGVNTHKGMVFCLALFCGAMKKLEDTQQKLTCKNISNQIAILSTDIVHKDLVLQTCQSAGARFFQERGHGGIREYAQKGFAIVFGGSLPFYKKELECYDESYALKRTLLWLMANLVDTTLYARGGMEGLILTQKQALKILEINTANENELDLMLEKFDKELIEKNLSPGGSADLLALTWLAKELVED